MDILKGLLTKRRPSAEYKYFLYDPEGEGMVFFKSIEDREIAAKRSISEYLDDTWNEDVGRVVAGEVTHAATQNNITKPEGKIDDEGIDESGEYWSGEIDYKCNYELVKL
jgi:hypothetical protein